VRWRLSGSAALLVVAILAASACGGGGGEKKSGGCTDVSVPSPREDSNHKAPTNELDPDKAYRVVVETNCGQFTITLDQKDSPKTSASFASLVRDGFYDATIFHRIVPNFVIQGGDPTAGGSGGPGYTTVEAPPPMTTYDKYVVAMAKTPSEPPGAAGSQFFIVTAANIELPAEYALLGNVTDGEAVVDRIGKLGNPTNEKPTRPVVIAKMSVNS
jgi:peptidyl-prolyl cis-trans isomerase B (cyclophilin B)